MSRAIAPRASPESFWSESGPKMMGPRASRPLKKQRTVHRRGDITTISRKDLSVYGGDIQAVSFGGLFLLFTFPFVNQ